MSKVRREVHTRTAFAYDKALFYFDKTAKQDRKSVNVCSCKTMKKYLQARRIYIHYTNEYQISQGLPLTR